MLRSEHGIKQIVQFEYEYGHSVSFIHTLILRISIKASICRCCYRRCYLLCPLCLYQPLYFCFTYQNMLLIVPRLIIALHIWFDHFLYRHIGFLVGRNIQDVFCWRKSAIVIVRLECRSLLIAILKFIWAPSHYRTIKYVPRRWIWRCDCCSVSLKDVLTPIFLLFNFSFLFRWMLDCFAFLWCCPLRRRSAKSCSPGS